MKNDDKDTIPEIEKEINKNLANMMTDTMACPHCGKLIGTLAGVPSACPHCKKSLHISVFKILFDFLKSKNSKS